MSSLELIDDKSPIPEIGNKIFEAKRTVAKSSITIGDAVYVATLICCIKNKEIEERLRTKMDEPQYCVYMYDPRKGDKPTRKDDEGIEFAYFKSEYDVDSDVMLRESIMDWDGLVIRDETDEEKAASAPQSAAKRRRRGHK